MVLALVAGVFFASYFEFGSRVPMIPLADKWLPDALGAGDH